MAVTDAQLEAADEQLLADLTAGVSSTTVDGETVTLLDPQKRIAALNQVRAQQSSVDPFACLRHRTVIPGGGGG